MKKEKGVKKERRGGDERKERKEMEKEKDGGRRFNVVQNG